MGKWSASLLGASALTNSFQSIQARIDGPVTYVVGTPVEYSVYVEFGTSRMAAQPYLRPAVEQAARNIPAIFRDANSMAAGIAQLALEIERVAKQLCPVDTGTLRSSISAERIR